MNINLSKLQETEKDWEAWRTVLHRDTKRWMNMTYRLNKNYKLDDLDICYLFTCFSFRYAMATYPDILTVTVHIIT